MDALTGLNDHMEKREKERNDVEKKRREESVTSESLVLKCEGPGCGFLGQTRAGL